jgi:hypothetical protein
MEDEMDGADSTNGREQKFIQSFIVRPEEKIPFVRRKGNWDNNIKMYVKEVGWEDVDWIHLAQNRDQR